MGGLLPESCCWCLSLRSGVILIAATNTILSLLYLVMTLTYSIKWTMEHPEESKHPFVEIIMALSIEYSTSLQIIFSAFLLYGAIKESSYITMSWLVCEVSVATTAVVHVTFMMFSHIVLFAEDIVVLLTLLGAMMVVYSYYDKMGKTFIVR